MDGLPPSFFIAIFQAYVIIEVAARHIPLFLLGRRLPPTSPVFNMEVERGDCVALNQKQNTFVAEYLVDLNATQAAIRAGYSEKTAYSIGQRLLKHVEIQNAIQKAMKEREERTEITQDRVLKEYARIAFFDPRKLFDDRGFPLEISEIDDDTAAALAGLEVVEGKEGEKDCYIIKYKITNKLGALDSLAKHLGLFDGKQETGDKVTVIIDV